MSWCDHLNESPAKLGMTQVYLYAQVLWYELGSIARTLGIVDMFGRFKYFYIWSCEFSSCVINLMCFCEANNYVICN